MVLLALGSGALFGAALFILDSITGTIAARTAYPPTYFGLVGFVLGFAVGIPAFGFYLRYRGRSTQKAKVPAPRGY
jgi:hypothetical protein